MNGYVRNWTGQPVANVRVTAVSPSDTCTTHTDKRGFFVCLTLPPDRYSVSAQKFGTSNAYATVRIDSDQTTFLVFRFNPLRNCPGYAQTPLTAEPFRSLDLRLMNAYPPNVAPPIYFPIAPIRQVYGCL
ncbi:MAG: carboxypeptidase-like regulatory domain-containing protein [Vulcanimicrobiaceae bacterium]